MSGPYRLRYLHLFIQQKSAGAFILSRNGRLADYVGAGADIESVLQRFARQSEYRYFWYAPSSSVTEAEALALTWRHRYRPTDNHLPPAADHAEDWRCTVEGCATCALTVSRV